MCSVNSDNPQSIGSTPLVKFIHITEGEIAPGQATFEGSISDYLVKYRTTAAEATHNNNQR